MIKAKTKLLTLLTTVFKDVPTFSLKQVYQVAEGPMAYYYPNNNTLRATIDLSLKELRDNGFLTVDNQGTYSWAQ
jgi:hypothetical protein